MVVDRGPSLVRTLTDTPGLNNHGDIAIWHSVSASLMPGVVFRGNETITIEGEKDFSLVYPADINDRLTVVGTLQQPQDLRFTHAFQWNNGHLETLPSLGGPYSAASAVNAKGDVVGNAQTGGGARHAVLWRSKQPRDLGLLAQGDYSSARDINDNGDVVGEANVVPNGKPQAFLWHGGQMQALPKLSEARPAVHRRSTTAARSLAPVTCRTAPDMGLSGNMAPLRIWAPWVVKMRQVRPWTSMPSPRWLALLRTMEKSGPSSGERQNDQPEQTDCAQFRLDAAGSLTHQRQRRNSRPGIFSSVHSHLYSSARYRQMIGDAPSLQIQAANEAHRTMVSSLGVPFRPTQHQEVNHAV